LLIAATRLAIAPNTISVVHRTLSERSADRAHAAATAAAAIFRIHKPWMWTWSWYRADGRTGERASGRVRQASRSRTRRLPLQVHDGTEQEGKKLRRRRRRRQTSLSDQAIIACASKPIATSSPPAIRLDSGVLRSVAAAAAAAAAVARSPRYVHQSRPVQKSVNEVRRLKKLFSFTYSSSQASRPRCMATIVFRRF